MNWERYNNLKRRDPSIKPKDCETEHTLTYSRLPGFEQLSSSQYAREILKRLEKRRGEAIGKRLSEGKGFASEESLRKQVPGARPRTTKTSTRETHRPLILTSCLEAKEAFLEWYFGMLSAYKIASRKFRSGILRVEFPHGTYLPTRLVILPT